MDDEVLQSDDDERFSFSGDGDAKGKAGMEAAFSDDGEPQHGDVVVVLPEPAPKKRKKALTTEQREFARNVHRGFLLVSVAIVQGKSAAADSELALAQALCFTEWPGQQKPKKQQKKGTVTWLKRIYAETEDISVCAAYVRAVERLPCRIVASIPYVSWKVVEEAERSASLEQQMVFWLEYWQGGEWCRVCPDMRAEPRIEEEEELCYVVAASDGELLDVTQRYAAAWSKCVRRRAPSSEDWWLETLALLSTKAERPWTQWERQATKERLAEEEIPRSLSGLKAHPTYVFEDHVPRYMALRPEAEAVGEFNGKRVFFRDDLLPIHSADKWIEKAKVVREGEQPCKKVDSRGKRGSQTLLYGPWQESISPMHVSHFTLYLLVSLFLNNHFSQVVDVEIGRAVDGKVPKNDHGNVYLYNESMMPGKRG